jgi:hypothetical protein
MTKSWKICSARAKNTRLTHVCSPCCAAFPTSTKNSNELALTGRCYGKPTTKSFLTATNTASWKARVNPTMHMDHKVGDKLYVDFAGEKMSYTDKETGEIIPVEVFVAILGASQLTYVEAVMSQQKEDFIAACENTLHFIGGVPAAIVPDNLKAAVTKGYVIGVPVTLLLGNELKSGKRCQEIKLYL